MPSHFSRFSSLSGNPVICEPFILHVHLCERPLSWHHAKPPPPFWCNWNSLWSMQDFWRLCCILKGYRFVHYFLFQFPGHLAALNVTSSRCFGNKCLGNKSQVVNTLETGVFSPQSSYDGKNKMHFITRVNFNSPATLYDF